MLKLSYKNILEIYENYNENFILKIYENFKILNASYYIRTDGSPATFWKSGCSYNKDFHINLLN